MSRLTRQQATWLNRGSSVGARVCRFPHRADSRYCAEIQAFVPLATTASRCSAAHGCGDPAHCDLRLLFRPG